MELITKKTDESTIANDGEHTEAHFSERRIELKVPSSVKKRREKKNTEKTASENVHVLFLGNFIVYRDHHCPFSVIHPMKCATANWFCLHFIFSSSAKQFLNYLSRKQSRDVGVVPAACEKQRYANIRQKQKLPLGLNLNWMLGCVGWPGER